DPDNWTPLWSTGESGNAGFAAFQGDGNLVVYNGDGTAHWSSGTSGTSGDFFLAVQDDGNLVIYEDGGATAEWSTGTHCCGAPVHKYPPKAGRRAPSPARYP